MTCHGWAQSLDRDSAIGLNYVPHGLGSPDGLPKSSNVQRQQYQVQEKDRRQPLDRAVGDEGEIAKDGEGAQQAHVLGHEGEQNQR